MRVPGARATLVGVLLGAVGCGPRGGPVLITPATPPVAADALPGHPTGLRTVTLDDLTSDALDPAAARATLGGAGFLGGSERWFARPAPGVRTVQTRILRFRTVAGADHFVTWLRSQVGALFGDGTVEAEAPLPGDGFVLVHRPGGCCAKDLPIALAVWHQGPTVLSIRAMGTVGAKDAVRYANALQASWARSSANPSRTSSPIPK